MEWSKNLIYAVAMFFVTVFISFYSGNFSSLHADTKANLFPTPTKGMCYEAFGPNYNPSTANISCIYFGSDIARKQTGALWGTKPYLANSTDSICRNDLKTMSDMGANLIRLYDWDPRNDHSQFLNACQNLKIKVVVPISNWLPSQNKTIWDQQIPNYFNSRNFGNSTGTGWHPAIAGVVITNEPILNSLNYDNVIKFVANFIQTSREKKFHKNVLVGIPVSFAKGGKPYFNGIDMPCWNLFNKLLKAPSITPYKSQIMLCANTYNSKSYLYSNAESTGKGWVPLTYQQFKAPILFTEIGLNRKDPNYTQTFIQEQLNGTIEYQKNNPGELLGPCVFQFSDKVWKEGTTEGSFGAFSHGTMKDSVVINTGQSDYSYWPGPPCQRHGSLAIDPLTKKSIYNQIIRAYK
ncbi:hypothetical protein [Desulfovibrio sp. UCD-KL4C]|uniref:hypothetical protein n=1 Tax=Desulfovibrio sp. UCD-KL4C TaxID=2578120 RepID=UPI0025C0449B|nr:hypothetical protein [Desulfovibrio sp. UCD-KL4C]